MSESLVHVPDDERDPLLEQPDQLQDDAQLILTPEQRKAILGRLAEFEVQLMGLAPAKQAFVLAYMADPTDATAAARKAGYSERRAHVTASELLKQPKVAALIALGQQVREDRTYITSDRTLNEIAIIAFSDIADYEIRGGEVKPRKGIPDYVTRAISSLEVTETTTDTTDGRSITTYKTKIRLWPKDAALRMLAVYQKLLANPAEGSVTIHDNRQIHNHQHNTWQFGDQKITF
jgi:phage terminase small subunit